MKEQVIEDISMEEVLEKLKDQRNKILEEFSRAFLAESGALPSEVELVHTSSEEDGKITNLFYFRKKEESKDA